METYAVIPFPLRNFFSVSEELEDDSMYQSAIMQSIPGSACVTLQGDVTNDMKEIMKNMIKELNNDCLFRIEMLRRYLPFARFLFATLAVKL
jgi:hypothetical protein